MPHKITKSCIQCELCAEQCPLGAIDQDAKGNFVSEATTYGTIVNISCRAELTPHQFL
jgi:formate hydrogenlyase subunit 6/NADH:ubiquinone oxidoreductase subunit I